jgi:hypothetical protein
MMIHNLIFRNNDPFVVSLLEKMNPFGLTQADGKSMFFQQQVDAYLYIMIQTWTQAPKGYIEMPLLIGRLYQHLTYKECVQVTQALRAFQIKMVLKVSDWQSKEAKWFLDHLANGLCSLTYSSYCSQHVDSAWQLFQQRLEIEKMSKMSNVK